VVALNLWAAWIGLLAGMVGGAAVGLFFHGEQWLGGYASWRRRLLRLGHVSFFGLAFVNLAFVVTVDRLSPAPGPSVPLPGDPGAGGLPAALRFASYALVAGSALMPVVCCASAFRREARVLFVLPVACLVSGVMALILGGLAT
jgi:hypothetical protein